MNPLNSILLEGNVVHQPDLSSTKKGSAYCKFSIASNRSYKAENGSFENEVSFFDVQSFGNLATACAKKCTQGRSIRVVGRLRQGRWKDSDGKLHTNVSVLAEHVEFKPERKKTEADASSKAPAPTEKELADMSASEMQKMEALQNMPNEQVDIPF